MDILKSHKHTMELFEMYEKDYRDLSTDYNTLQLQNEEIKLHFKKKLAAERKEKMALSQEIHKLKKELQKFNSMSGDKVASVEVVSSSAGQNLIGKQSPEHQMLAAQLTLEKMEKDVLSQNITELNHQLQVERDLRAKAEAQVDEAVDIADELIHKLEAMHNISDEPSFTPKMLDTELKAKVEAQHLEIQELKKIVQKERELRAQAEDDKFEAIKVAEEFCKEAEEIKSCYDNATNMYRRERKEKSALQQEIVELLQKQNSLQDQMETDSQKDFEILEALCQELAELKRVSEDHSAERQTLVTKLEKKDKEQKGLRREILCPNEKLEELRAHAEAEKHDATEVAEALCKEAEHVKICYDNDLQTPNTMLKSLKTAKNRYKAERREKNRLQQEIEELLQKQNDLRDQNETGTLREFEILEALVQELADLERVSEDHSAKSMEKEDQQERGLWEDVVELVQMLEEEMKLRARAESDKLEAIEVAEILCEKMEKCKVCSRYQEGKAEADKPEADKDVEALYTGGEDMKRCSDNILQKPSKMEKTIKDESNKYMAEKKDGIQQKIVEWLKIERDQGEIDSLMEFEILEALCEEWES